MDDMRHAPDDALSVILAPALAPLFQRPTRLDVACAWHAHVPFAHWIVGTVRPGTLVEIGTRTGVSYAAFCETVLAQALPTRCYAVIDRSDPNDQNAVASLQNVHAARYAGFSRLLNGTQSEALASIADASVDLLHIDTRYPYAAASRDFAAWLPKLSRTAVVLLHATRESGNRQLFAELSAGHPSFEFLQGSGLGILLVGAGPPAALAALCSLSGAPVNIARERFALLGERWSLHATLRDLQNAGTLGEKAQADIKTLRPAYDKCLAAHRSTRSQLAEARFALAAEMRAAEACLHVQSNIENLGRRLSERQAQLADTQARLSETQAKLGEAQSKLADSQAETASLQQWRTAVLQSRSWRLVRLAQRLRRPGVAVSVASETQSQDMTRDHNHIAPVQVAVAEPVVAAQPAPTDRPRILYISGESHTPGHVYRVERALAAAVSLGWTAEWSEPGPVNPDLLRGAAIVVLWRVPYSGHIQGIVDCARGMGARIVFDVDDLMFRRDYATAQMIDGIRSQRFSETDTQDFFEKIGRTMAQVDVVTCPTEELASQVRFVGKPAFVLPNGFAADSVAVSRLAVRTWRGFPDRTIRIGYAGGSRTHQRDFAQAVPALARILAETPQALLVLFRDPDSGEGVILVDEYDLLAPFAHQIEWRDMVALAELPRELARFDINLAPLELDNLFCAAKSELKYFEAALAGVPTIASPVGRLGRAITAGETGLLAADEAGWYNALRTLVGDADLRRRMGSNAYHDALWRSGPQQRQDRMRSLFAQLSGGIIAAAAFEHDIRPAALHAPRWPDITSSRLVLSEDRLAEAAVTIVIPLHDYADYVVEALASAAAQTLECLDLIIVDDASTDDSLDMAREWCESHKGRFNRLQILSHTQNAGLAAARNSGFAAAETPFVLPLDADNRLRPSCCVRLLETLAGSDAAFAYPAIRHFGTSDAIIGSEQFSALRLLQGNYIDAMALVAKWAWAGAGGYAHIRYGWEDFDFWARLVELGQYGISVPDVLAEYRVHRASMLHTTTEVHDHKRDLVDELTARHAWLDIGRLADPMT